MGRLGSVLALAVVALVACASDGSPSGPDRTVGVYEGIIRWSLSDEPAPPTQSKPPVVYVVTVDGDSLSPGAQTDVVRDLKDDVTVRFADHRAEAIDDRAPGDPVRDGGVLLLIGAVVHGTGPLAVDLTVYRSASAERPTRVRLEQRAEDWTVTAAAPIGSTATT
jgi:hypothetical protein